jgi:MFS family permease
MLGAGAITDTLGAKRAFVAGLLVFTASSAVCAAATSMLVLNVARLVQGAGSALLLPSALVLATASATDEQARHRLVGWWAAAGGVGMAAGPLLGGALVALAIGSICAAPLAQRIGRPAVLGIGQAVLATTLLAVAWASTSSELWPLVLALVPAGFSSGLLVPTMTSQSIAAVEPALHGPRPRRSTPPARSVQPSASPLSAHSSGPRTTSGMGSSPAWPSAPPPPWSPCC